MSPSPDLSISVVFLTMGDRPAELTRAIASVLRQSGDKPEIVVVANGGDAADTADMADADGVSVVRLAHNIGIPAGRNAGWQVSSGEVVVFVDDDGWLDGDDVFSTLRQQFCAQPRLGIVSFRIADPDGGPGARRHVPRLRASDPMRSGPVTTFLGGACAIRRDVLDRVGGLPDNFFYAHEETDLAWRALDDGWDIFYGATTAMFHPATAPSRHATYYRLNARNRVWLARRRLPWLLVPMYTGTWALLTVVRTRDRAGLRTWFHGFSEGWRADPGDRDPMSWHTVWRMTRLGRPPVI